MYKPCSILRLRFIFIFCLVLGLNAAGQDKIIEQIKLSQIGESREKQFAEGKTQIIVECSNEAEAAAAAKTLKMTNNVDNPANLTAHIAPKVDKAKLLFELKDKLAPGETFLFAFVQNDKDKKGVLTLKKVKANPGSNAAAESKYTPEVPGSFTVLNDVDLSLPATTPGFSRQHYESVTKLKRSNRLVYSFCENTLYYDKKDKKRFRPRVGTPLSLELNPAPNPLRYDVFISSEYKNYGTSSDPLLERLLLNPAELITTAHAGVDDGKALSPDQKRRKELVLGYLYRINAELQQFMDYYLYQADCVNATDFLIKKNKIEQNLNAKLKAATELKYTGNFIDLIKIEFHDYDSNLVRPFVQTYAAFKNLNISPVHYQIPRLQNYDELAINLKIRPKDKSNASMKVDSMLIDLPVYSGFKVDISPGLFYTFFSPHMYTLYSDSTMIKGISGVDSVTARFKSIIKENKSKNNVGFSSLIHFYSRWGRVINVAASLGAGITLEDDPKVRYFTGASLLIGRVNRLALSTGWAFGKVEEISDRYWNGTGYKQVNSAETKLEMKKVLKTGWFIGLSYNIPLIERKTPTAAASKTESNPNKVVGSGSATTPATTR